MTRVISIIVSTLFFCYLLAASLFFYQRREPGNCKDVIVEVKDSLDKHFVSESDILSLLRGAGLNPIKKPLAKVNTDRIETELLKNEMIANIEAYKTPSGYIKLEIRQKMPILRVIGNYGNFYVDNNGSLMPVSQRYVVHVPIATGNVEKELAMTDLYKFALFLRENDFWNDQIDQIFVHPDGEVELIPRVGDFRIRLGAFTDFEEKLANLKLFYEQAIPKVGWEKYSLIDLKYKNQIVCTKK
ncbi:cell division protein FtsQ/DivIB [Parabacteroides sp. Marseille-P3160]|uniref:cell division protein FtsQ/DivIB n=1 Tax=Parabacteroides sp. Marseille-P3160 TaxID=1917887 RepID=UPI0009BB75B8|nr:cell division protein FtsQ/DivIB [Parabacteroides sp. Marseille-P3160]